MSSDSENASSLKARLKAKLKKAGVTNSDSSDEEDKSKKKKTGPKSSTSAKHETPAHNKISENCTKQTAKLVQNRNEIFLGSSDGEEELMSSKYRKPKPLESDESDSEDSTVIQPRASSKKRAIILSSSEDEEGPGDATGSESDGSDDESGSDIANSNQSEDSDSEACSMIDNEAEEGDESDVSAEEEPHGETLSTEPSESDDSEDWEDDWISDTDEPCPKRTEPPSKHVVVSNEAAASCGFASDSSDGTSEKCPICLLRFTKQEVGTPESCDHIFCAECLEQWSKNVNTCPVDRQEFTLILVRRRVGGKVVRQIPVERAEAKDPEEVEDPTYCEVCGNCDREDRMLLCDGCDLGYHMECLDPPLSHVPLDNWYCSECDNNSLNNSNGPVAEEVDFAVDEVRELLEDAQNLVGAPQQARRAPRMLPRTQQFERVLRRIRSTFLQRQEALQSQPSTSSGIDSHSGEPVRKKRKVVKRKATSKKKRRTTTKRKTKKTSRKKTTAASSKSTTKKKTSGKKRKARKSVGTKSKKLKVC